MKILITGVAGFIGFHLAKNLVRSNIDVFGLDNLNTYYDKNLKLERIKILKKIGLKFFKIDICNHETLENFSLKHNFDIIVHLAAQAGVRYSIKNPRSYIDSNIIGFFNILECCRQIKVKHFIYASSSSVYGGNSSSPFYENQKTEQPQNLYAASKKSNELMSYSYSSLYKIPSTGLRFFTVYGPWGRPDMAYFKFVKNIYDEIPIDIYGNGKMYRDFTYIDDIVDGILKLIDRGPPSTVVNDTSDAFKNNVPWEIYNIGNSNVISLEKFIEIIENLTGKIAKKNYLSMQLGDMKLTSANIQKIETSVNFVPKTSIKVGLSNFVEWYKSFYHIK